MSPVCSGEPTKFTVNGAACEVAGDAQMPLLLALRNELNLNGTRQGCATGHCGACTVLMDGRPVASCTLPLDAVSGHDVETVEMLQHDPVGRAVIAAFLHEQAGQCGYCLAGILVTATAFLKRKSTPTRREIAEALDGHLCRCGAHHRMLNAVARAAGDLAGGNGEAA